jgi:hypothetical protein
MAVLAMNLGRFRRVLTAAALAAVFISSWFFRFNDPDGSFAGLTDDHFFYVVRGWQILLGDLPVRDFVDHGAPLYYYIAAGVQQVFGRGTLPELLFSVTMLSIGATLTCWLATRASGSLMLGLFAAIFQILLAPRFYNYPKILAYAIGIPLLWSFAERPGPAARGCLALWTVVAFLLRHDHGVFFALSVVVLVGALRDLPLRDRVRHAAAYVASVLALVSPYLLFIQMNGGLGRYFRDAASWAAKDRSRAPIVFPGLFDNPGGLQANLVAWMYYFELLLPLVALALIAISRDAFRPQWSRAAAKMISVAALGILLNAGFLRSPLAARLADPSVPHAILIAWLGAATSALLQSRGVIRARLQGYAAPIRVIVTTVVVLIGYLLGTSLTTDLGRRLEKASLTEGPRNVLERSTRLARKFQDEWRFGWQHGEGRPDLINLVMYLDACTRPQDRIFVQPYIPQVLGLARRGFAGGHADLRPGFFTAPEAQVLTLERLRRQSVLVALLDTDDSYRNFRKAFPLIAEYFDQEYMLGGTGRFDGRFGIQLFVRRDAVPTRRYGPLDWPCYR